MSSGKFFIAIVMPPPVLEHVEQIKNDLYQMHGLRGALRSPAHITLHRPFDWNLQKMDKLRKFLGNFKYPSSFELHLSNFAFFEPRVIYIDVVQNPVLDQLHGELSKEARKQLQLFNETDDERGFHPHVTVAFRDLKKPLFHQLKPRFQQMSFDAKFVVDRIALLKLEDRWEVFEEYPFQ